MTSYQKSDSIDRCVFTSGTILPNSVLILIQSETTEPWDFFEEVIPTRFQEQEQQHMRSVPDLKMEMKTAIVNRLYLIMFLL